MKEIRLPSEAALRASHAVKASDGSDYLITFDIDNLTFGLTIIEAQPVVLLGDVDNDGAVNIKDVTILIDYLLGGSVEDFNAANADVNQDQSINIADVTRLIDNLLGGGN